MSVDSDDDSVHPTPSDMTTAAHCSPRSEPWPSTKAKGDFPLRVEEEVRRIHYIESPAQPLTSARISAQVGALASQASPQTDPSNSASTAASAASGPQTVPAAIEASLSMTPAHPTPSPTTDAVAASVPSASILALPIVADSGSAAVVAAGALKTAAPIEQVPSAADSVSARQIASASSSAASTPVSTPGGPPQTYARKRGRPRKHPLPDPNNPPPPKTKRKLSADGPSAATKRKVAARSAASNLGALLSVPDLGRLIPQGSTAENAQDFIQNNLRLFADLFVALQKQATTDHGTPNEANSKQLGISSSTVINDLSSTTLAEGVSLTGSVHTPVEPSQSSVQSVTELANASDVASRPVASALTGDQVDSASKVPGLSDAIRDEIRKKLADVTRGREAIHAEMLQMRVDASFFENAQKTVDERIGILRERIAKHTAILEREREATRKAREATRKAKKDRNARERSLRDSEREERRLAQTFAQLEREIAAEEEERRRLEAAEESDEEDGEGSLQTSGDSRLSKHFTERLQGVKSPSDGASASSVATPSDSAGVSATDRAIGFSDEELARVLGISTSELEGFSQTLDFGALQPPSSDASAVESTHAPPSILDALLPSAETQQGQTTQGNAADTFDVAAFLEMATSFGVDASGEQGISSSTTN